MFLLTTPELEMPGLFVCSVYKSFNVSPSPRRETIPRPVLEPSAVPGRTDYDEESRRAVPPQPSRDLPLLSVCWCTSYPGSERERETESERERERARERKRESERERKRERERASERARERERERERLICKPDK